MGFPQVLNVEIYVYFSQVAYWVFIEDYNGDLNWAKGKLVEKKNIKTFRN